MDDSMEGSGGSNPSQLGVRSFTAARAGEIASLTVQLGNRKGNGIMGNIPTGRGFFFQHVAPHMRRRAVSHNPKRVPSRLRMGHLAQVKKNPGALKPRPKRPSRTFRKRPEKNVLEYNRRQLQNPNWLETHIWHAKRFHMKTMWDRRVAWAPTMKCFRSLFRAARRSAIMQDVSYLACLEVSGPKDTIIIGLKKMFWASRNEVQLDSYVALSCREEFLGRVFKPNYCAEPDAGQYIGSVRCLWVPVGNDEKIGKFILWVHPASKTAVVEHIVTVLELLEEEPLYDEDDEAISFPSSPNIDEKKYLWKTLNNTKWVSLRSSVELKDLSGCVGRIKLTGPKVLSILKDVLKVGTFTGEPASSVKEQQEALWNNLTRMSDIPAASVIPLNVMDPRLELPKKRTPAVDLTPDKSQELVSEIPVFRLDTAALTSPLWDEQVRMNSLRTKVSDSDLAQIRSKNLIPGTAISSTEKMNVVPVVVITRNYATGRNQRHAFAGADLIVPNGWMMPFWIALSYRCVRAHGMEFNDYLTFEEDGFLGPDASTYFAPDADVYNENAEKHTKLVKQEFFSRPPANRPNLITNACAFPFSVDWGLFIKFVCNLDFEPQVTVLRDRNDFLKLLRFVKGIRKKKKSQKDLEVLGSLLVKVKLTLLSGSVSERAAMCAPTVEDLERFHSEKGSKTSVNEAPREDFKRHVRKSMWLKHKKTLSRLAMKRKVARKAAKNAVGLTGNPGFDLEGRLAELDSKSVSEAFNMKMSDMWWDSDAARQLSYSTRKVIGIATYAHYSFSEGKCGAVGYVPVAALKELCVGQKSKPKLLVMVRDWSKSLTYHWAQMKVCEIHSDSITTTT